MPDSRFKVLISETAGGILSGDEDEGWPTEVVDARAFDAVEAELTAAQSENREQAKEIKRAVTLLNPACADETLEGAIRNLQQAYISERDNAVALEQENREQQARIAELELERELLPWNEYLKRATAKLESELARVKGERGLWPWALEQMKAGKRLTNADLLYGNFFIELQGAVFWIRDGRRKSIRVTLDMTDFERTDWQLADAPEAATTAVSEV